jgi:hypothetical protein
MLRRFDRDGINRPGFSFRPLHSRRVVSSAGESPYENFCFCLGQSRAPEPQRQALWRNLRSFPVHPYCFSRCCFELTVPPIAFFPRMKVVLLMFSDVVFQGDSGLNSTADGGFPLHNTHRTDDPPPVNDVLEQSGTSGK